MVIENKQKIFYIDFLDFISLFLAVTLKPFYHQVYFHNAIRLFQSKTARNRLNLIGIKWLSHHDTPLHVYCRSFQELNPKLSDKVLTNKLQKQSLYYSIIQYFQLDQIGINKFDSTLKKLITRKWLVEGTTSLSLIEYIFKDKNSHITYIPSTTGNYLMALEFENHRITPLKIYLVLNGINIVIKNVFRKFYISIAKLTEWSCKHERKEKVYPALTNSNYEFAFVPHAGFRYGNFFNKTYLYENNTDSFFYKQKILTLAFNDLPEVSERFCRMHKIPYHNIASIRFNKHILFELLKLLKKYKYFGTIFKISLNNIINNIILFYVLVKIIHYKRQLIYYKYLKIIYFHYDILVQNPFLIACHINRIKTVSSQERPLASVWCDPLIFDHYFINGPRFKEMLAKRGHCIGKYHIVGSMRSSKINECGSTMYSKQFGIRKNQKLLACFDITHMSHFGVGVGGDTISLETHIEFYNSLYELSKRFNNLFILIKPKDINNLYYNDKFSIYLNCNQSNFKIITDLKKFKSYNIASAADIIIGKQTSILEESFSAGKKVIFYDNEGFISTTDYVFNDTDYVARSYSELERIVLKIVNNNKYSNDEKIRKMKYDYFYSCDDYSGPQLIKKEIKKIYSNLE